MIPAQAIALIEEFEALKLEAYLCPAGVWTIGYGSTTLDGRPVKPGDKLRDAAAAEMLLIAQLKNDYLPKLRFIPGWEEFNAAQQSALISFAWNLGPGFYGAPGFPTLTRALDEENPPAIAEAIKLYDKANGKALAGLTRRRQREAELFLEGYKPKSSEPTMTEYFLDFALSLDRDGKMGEGRLCLRSLSPEGGRTHQVWVATTSTGTRQAPEGFHAKGGPIPPEYRVPNLKAWVVQTNPIYMPNVKGVEGNFYKIDPHLITTDKGGQRGDFGIHLDANAPGSLGCIVLNMARFKTFEAEMTKLRNQGIKRLPLFITYPTP